MILPKHETSDLKSSGLGQADIEKLCERCYDLGVIHGMGRAIDAPKSGAGDVGRTSAAES